MSQLYFGCDPEVFASYTHKTKKSEFIDGKPFAMSPAYLEKAGKLKAIGGDDKHPVYIYNADYKIIGDGAAFEINFNHPFKDITEMYLSTKNALEELGDTIPKILRGGSLFKEPVINFDYNRFWTPDLEETDPKAWWGVVFGCDPDKDAFDTEWNCNITDASKHPFRYGGGHIHVSGSDAINMYPLIYVKLMAIYCGNFCIANSPFPEAEKLRAKYYGKPGKYRIQNYSDGTQGVEYRTPSNAWLSWTLDEIYYFGHNIRRAVETLSNPERCNKVLREFSNPTMEAIATADVGLSKRILHSLPGGY